MAVTILNKKEEKELKKITTFAPQNDDIKMRLDITEYSLKFIQFLKRIGYIFTPSKITKRNKIKTYISK